MNAMTQPATTGLPSTIRYARILIAIQIYRLIGLIFIVPLQNGNLPASFVIPAATGDALTGITAPIIAYALRKGGPKTWAAALVWNALGLADLFNAVSLGSLTGSATYILNNLAFILVGVTLGIILHITATILLLRKQTTNQILKI